MAWDQLAEYLEKKCKNNEWLRPFLGGFLVMLITTWGFYQLNEPDTFLKMETYKWLGISYIFGLSLTALGMDLSDAGSKQTALPKKSLLVFLILVETCVLIWISVLVFTALTATS